MSAETKSTFLPYHSKERRLQSVRGYGLIIASKSLSPAKVVLEVVQAKVGQDIVVERCLTYLPTEESHI